MRFIKTHVPLTITHKHKQTVGHSFSLNIDLILIPFSLIIFWTTMPFYVNVWDTRLKHLTFLPINTVKYTDLPQMVNRIPSCILYWHICIEGSLCWFSITLIINNAVEKFMLHCKWGQPVLSQWLGGTSKIYPK